MRGLQLLQIARELVEVPSPSGREGPALAVAESLLRGAGLEVLRQPVSGDERCNLLAFHGKPRSVLASHIDTVPGELPVRIEEQTLHGRGACDAKGILAAMIGAAAALRAGGRSDFGLLVLVGEETTSDGAIRANGALGSGDFDWPARRILVGEPTENRWATAHPGVLVLHVRASGRSAHSAYPEDGDSAVHALLEALTRIRGESWPSDPELGDTRVNVGAIRGGVAANVVAEEAEARLMIRTGAAPRALEERLRSLAGEAVHVETVCASPPVRFRVPDSARNGAGPVPFATDAPFLERFGDRYLLGPGSIRNAHSEQERITLPELEQAVDIYADWVREELHERSA